VTLIIGFDPSKCTGYAIFDTARHMSSITCGCLELPDKSDQYFTADQIGLKVTALLRECKKKHGAYPEFAVLEQQIAAQASMAGRGQSFAGSIYPWIATSAIVATLSNFGVPYGSLMPSTWRKSFFGEKFKPEKKEKESSSQAWKRAAIKECERIGIILPSKKALADDAAEACALAICWANKEMKFHAGRYYQPWISLVQRRNERAVA
jgi:Holliday junction resolvasome RuvABC endonuclease subunit